MEQGIFLTEQGIIFAEQGILAPEQGIGPRINFLTVRRYPTKFPLTQSMSSTGATADGFDRQFGIGRAGDAPCQLIGNGEALCQSIDPGRASSSENPFGAAGRHSGSPSRFSACTCPMSARHIASTAVGLLQGNAVPETVRFKCRHFRATATRIQGAEL